MTKDNILMNSTVEFNVLTSCPICGLTHSDRFLVYNLAFTTRSALKPRFNRSILNYKLIVYFWNPCYLSNLNLSLKNSILVPTLFGPIDIGSSHNSSYD